MGARNLNSLEEHLKSTSAIHGLLWPPTHCHGRLSEVLESRVQEPAEVVVHLALCCGRVIFPHVVGVIFAYVQDGSQHETHRIYCPNELLEISLIEHSLGREERERVVNRRNVGVGKVRMGESPVFLIAPFIVVVRGWKQSFHVRRQFVAGRGLGLHEFVT